MTVTSPTCAAASQTRSEGSASCSAPSRMVVTCGSQIQARGRTGARGRGRAARLCASSSRRTAIDLTRSRTACLFRRARGRIDLLRFDEIDVDAARRGLVGGLIDQQKIENARVPGRCQSRSPPCRAPPELWVSRDGWVAAGISLSPSFSASIESQESPMKFSRVSGFVALCLITSTNCLGKKIL
jgi:hypothetical protein